MEEEGGLGGVRRERGRGWFGEEGDGGVVAGEGVSGGDLGRGGGRELAMMSRLRG